MAYFIYTYLRKIFKCNFYNTFITFMLNLNIDTDFYNTDKFKWQENIFVGK